MTRYGTGRCGEVLWRRVRLPMVIRQSGGTKKPNTAVNQQIAALTVKEANSDVRAGIKALYMKWKWH